MQWLRDHALSSSCVALHLVALALALALPRGWAQDRVAAIADGLLFAAIYAIMSRLAERGSAEGTDPED